MTTTRLLLCSASPRRRDLLAGLGLVFEVVPARLDESRRPGEPVSLLPERLARDKAQAALSDWKLRGGAAAVALAADTVVILDGDELGKPRSREEARHLLRRLSGREHQVITGVCAVGPEGQIRSRAVVTQVTFRALTELQIQWLADSGDGDDKAGGYGIQGLAGAFIDRIDGSASNVIGLPLAEALELLGEVGLRLPWDRHERAP